MDEERVKEMIRQELTALLSSMERMSIEVGADDEPAAYVVGRIVDYTRTDLRLNWHEESALYEEKTWLPTD